MGVLGLTPFLQRTCPQVIKYLPDRLRSLSGKTIVIDGTLITQRFHYAPDPHQYRHVLGWYRLLAELDATGVSAVCVFDGKERNVAKTREGERRRDIQRQNSARGVLEIKRSHRLQELWDLLRRFRKLDNPTRRHVVDVLQQLCTGTQGRLNSPLLAQRVILPPPEVTQALFPQRMEDSYGHHEVLLTSDSILNKPLDFHRKDAHLPIPKSSQGNSDEIPLAGQEQHLTSRDIVDGLHRGLHNLHEWTPPLYEVPRTEENIASKLSSLYLDYKKSLSTIADLASPLESHLTLTRERKTSYPDTQAEIAITKAQYQLTVEEGNFWDKFVTSASEAKPAETHEYEEALSNLTQMSEMMSDSFQRRMRPPYQVYKESKELIRAMGIPCIETIGTFEAEALACSIVLNGLADYVASEDTDVLVYGAPLIRNITNRTAPLMLISGSDIYTALGLSPKAFVDFALLLGTDFTQRIKYVGPARALKLVREHGTIESLIRLLAPTMSSEVASDSLAPSLPLPTSKPIPRGVIMPTPTVEAYLAEVRLARLIFTTLPSPPGPPELVRQGVNEEGLTRLLLNYGLSRAVADEMAWDHSVGLEGNYFEDNPSASL